MTSSEETAQNDNTPESAAAVPAEASPEAQLAEKIALLEEELGKMREQWMRAVAETENVRKRAQKEQEDTARYAKTAFAGDMVSVLENLKRASESIPAEARGSNDMLKTLGQGVDLTLQELLAIFERNGIVRIDPKGQKFDHNLHQAVAQVESTDAPPGTIIQVVQAGYRIHDRLLRPAMVAVAKAPGEQKKLDETA